MKYFLQGNISMQLLFEVLLSNCLCYFFWNLIFQTRTNQSGVECARKCTYFLSNGVDKTMRVS